MKFKLFEIFIAILVVFVFILVMKIFIYFLKKENNYFKRNKKRGTALIVGYDSESSGCDVRFSVKLLNYENINIYNLKGLYNVKKAGGTLDERYPNFKIGDEVKVLYAKKIIFGKEWYDIRLDYEQYKYPN